MTSYLLRFTLRRALIATALLALFLGWLRLERAEFVHERSFNPDNFKETSLTLRPTIYPREILIHRLAWPDGDVHWYFGIPDPAP